VVKPKLFQFWNTERAPDDIEELMSTWANDPEFEYHRFSEHTAGEFIGENFDNRAFGAYKSCAVPAMQSDFFRYCVLYEMGGVYIDAATQNAGGLKEYIENFSGGILIRREKKEILPNGFMYFPKPRSALLQVIIETAIQNIEKKVSNNVWLVTGPGIQSSLFFGGSEIGLFSDIEIRPMLEVRKVVRFRQDVEHKKSNSDWRNFLNSGRSIFR